MGVVFMLLITIGQIVTSLGASMSDPQLGWYAMWAGRTLFGLGGESLSVVQSAFVAKYFQGKELAFALGVNLALARVGSVINDVVSALIANAFPFYYAYWMGSVICGLSLISMIVAYYVDISSENIIRAARGAPPLHGQGLFQRIAALCCRCCMRRPNPGNDEDNGGPKEEIHMSAVFKFPLTFWILTGSCISTYICVLT